jgi:hypothetical protein
VRTKCNEAVGLSPRRGTPRAGDASTVCDRMGEPIQDGIPRLNYYFGSPRIESESIYALVDSADGSVSVLMALPFVPIVGVRYAFALPDSSLPITGRREKITTKQLIRQGLFRTPISAPSLSLTLAARCWVQNPSSGPYLPFASPSTNCRKSLSASTELSYWPFSYPFLTSSKIRSMARRLAASFPTLSWLARRSGNSVFTIGLLDYACP